MVLSARGIFLFGKHMKKVFFLLFFLFSAVIPSRLCFASNVSVTNVSLTEQDAENTTVKIEFDISWDNSWRNVINRDAVWVFARYYHSGDAQWYPIEWSGGTPGEGVALPTNWSAGTGTPLEFFIPYDAKDYYLTYGFILQRSAEGSGSVDTDNVQFVWDWGGLDLTGVDSVIVKVFAIEMVYVGSGGFEIGDGDGANESTNAFHLTGSSTYNTVQYEPSITTVDPNAYDDAQLDIIGVGIDIALDANGDGTIDNGYFPTGFFGMYVMKYEISQGQYVSFLNTLDSSMQANRYPGYNGTNRHTISCSAGTCSYNSRADRACNYLSWMDLCAYCDWAGLRPMTEPEFELAARGNGSAYTSKEPVVGEYAWGTTSYNYAQTISGTENGTETISYPDGANVCYGGSGLSSGDAGNGPVRVGIFATSTSNREKAGAGYQGAMELSGNVEEQCVSLGSSAGRNYDGSHGDGILIMAGTGIGNADNSGWPGYSSTAGVFFSTGSGRRGGSWASTGTEIATSDRSNASNPVAGRDSGIGGRCVRSVGSYYPPP